MTVSATSPPTDGQPESPTLAQVDPSFAAALAAARETSPTPTPPPTQPAPAPAPRQLVQAAGKFQLPGAPRAPHADISRSMIWVYGEPKIGKTTLASEFPGLWFIATEKGQDWVTTREPTLITSWDNFLEFCAWFNELRPTHFADGEPIRALGIDTVDGLFKMCFEHVCQEMGVQDPGEIPHGGGWGRLSKEFERVMGKIRQWPYGLVCISHARTKEFKTKSTKRDRSEPNIGAAGFRWCAAAADLIMYAYSDEYPESNEKGELTGKVLERRQLLCHPQSSAVAGGRMVKQQGLPVTIPLDFKELVKYFPGTFAPQTGETRVAPPVVSADSPDAGGEGAPEGA